MKLMIKDVLHNSDAWSRIEFADVHRGVELVIHMRDQHDSRRFSISDAVSQRTVRAHILHTARKNGVLDVEVALHSMHQDALFALFRLFFSSDDCSMHATEESDMSCLLMEKNSFLAFCGLSSAPRFVWRVEQRRWSLLDKDELTLANGRMPNAHEGLDVEKVRDALGEAYCRAFAKLRELSASALNTNTTDTGEPT